MINNFEEINNAGGLTGLSLSNNINNISSVNLYIKF
jgi:hypothetical protein